MQYIFSYLQMPPHNALILSSSVNFTSIDRFREGLKIRNFLKVRKYPLASTVHTQALQFIRICIIQKYHSRCFAYYLLKQTTFHL